MKPGEKAFGVSILKALNTKKCVTNQMPSGHDCKGDGNAAEFKDEISFEEFRITGLCQACQDYVYDELLKVEDGDHDDPEFLGEALKTWSDDELREEYADLMEWLDGSPEDGPRTLSDSQMVYIKRINDELARRKDGEEGA